MDLEDVIRDLPRLWASGLTEAGQEVIGVGG